MKDDKKKLAMLILGSEKDKGDDGDMDYSDSEEAGEALIEALKEEDASGVVSAFRQLQKACSSKGSDEDDDEE